MAKRILVLGASGMLGSSLVPYLRDCGYDVLTHSRSSNADFNFQLINGNQLARALESFQPNILINLAGLVNVEACEIDINEAYLANTHLVESIVHSIRQFSPDCHLIQISTDHVYDGFGPQSENHVNIKNNYALSKYAGELAAAYLSSTILRTNFVGRSRAAHRVSLTDWAYKSIVALEPIQVFDDIYFSPLSISVLLEMIILVINEKPCGIYNLGSRNGMSKADLILAFAECLKLPTNLVTRVASTNAGLAKVCRPKDMRMDVQKFECFFGISLPILADLIQPLAREYI